MSKKFTEKKHWVYYLYKNNYSGLENVQKIFYTGTAFCKNPFRTKIHKETARLSKSDEYSGYGAESYNQLEQIPLGAKLKNLIKL